MASPNTAAIRLLPGVREPVYVATTGNIALLGLQTVDSTAVPTGKRVLVWQQTDKKENGIYDSSSGTWFRSADARSSRSINKGVQVPVQTGPENGSAVFVFDTLDPNIGTDDIDIVLYYTQGLLDTLQGIVGSGSFLQSGTGAVTRSVQNKLRDYAVNILEFGAILDGAFDNATAIGKAITAAAGKRPVLIPAVDGICLSGLVTCTVANTHFIIDSGATWKRKADGGVDSKWIYVNGADNVVVDIYGTLDGNKAVQTGPQAEWLLAAINFNNSNNCSVNGHGSGRIINSKNNGVGAFGCDKLTVQGLEISAGGTKDGGGSIQMQKCPRPNVLFNRLIGNPSSGIKIMGADAPGDAALNSDFARVIGNVVDWRAISLNNSLLSPGQNYLGIEIFGIPGSQFTIVQSNHVLGSEIGGDPAFGISTGTDCTGVIINSNVVRGDFTHHTIVYGIEATATDCMISDNVVEYADVGVLTARSATIANNRLRGCRTNGVFAYDSAAGAGGPWSITGNKFRDCGYKDASSAVLVFTGTNTAGTIVQSNEFFNDTQSAARDISIMECGVGHVKFDNNVVRNTNAGRYSFIRFSSATSVGGTVLGNSFLGANGFGIAILIGTNAGKINIQLNEVSNYSFPWNTAASFGFNVVSNNLALSCGTPAGVTLGTDFVTLNRAA